MKTILLFILSVSLFTIAGAQTTEFITIKDFQAEKKKLAEGINAAKKMNQDLKRTLARQNEKLDSLQKFVSGLQAQLATSNDSINSLKVKTTDLRDQLESSSSISRSKLLFAFGFILIVMALLIVMIFMIKKKSDQNFILLEKTDSKIDQGLNKTEEEIRGNRALMMASADELNQKLTSGFERVETRSGSIEQQVKEITITIEEKISRLKQENDLLTRQQEEKMNALRSWVDQETQELSSLITNIDKNQKGIVPGIMDNLNVLKTEMEEKIKSISAEISKFRIK
jgi:septal ring factor EnvC (AmiA/AmiB activator)